MKKDKAVRKAEMKAAAIKYLKSLIGPVIILGVIAAMIIYIVTFQEEEVPEEIIKVNAFASEEKSYTLENDELLLEMDAATTQFKLTVKDTGKVWYSNPEGIDDDSIALGKEKNKLKSTMLLTYSNIHGVDTLFNNYEYSMENGIYEIIADENSIRVNYSIGDMEKEFTIPPVITKTRFDEFVAKMDKGDAVMVTEYYKKYDINNLGKKDDKEALLASYPILETEVIYVLRDTTKDSMKKKFEQFFEAAGYTYEDYLADKELDQAQKVSDKPVFNVNMIYTLEGDDLVVTVPMSEMEYREDYPIYYLSILPYFGAGGTADEGYMVVPEGGGAIINFNNGKTLQNSYYANVYGWDMAQGRTAVVHETEVSFGTFGISHGDDSFVCVIESGAPYAAIQSDISGKSNSFNFVNAVYTLVNREQYDIGDRYNGEMYIYQEALPDEDLVQRYSFVDSGSYVDMAKDYGAYLENRYSDVLTMNDDTQTPVAIEILGAVDKVKQVFGVPVSRPLELTTYAEAKGILEDLKNEGMDNLSVKLTGWMNGGVQQKILTKVKLISDLGNKKDLQNLVNYANDNGIDIYLDGSTDYAYDSDIWDGFFVYTDAARLVSKEKVELYEYSTVTYGERTDLDPYYLLHADIISEMTDNLTDYASQLGAGVSFREIGDDLSSDFYRKDPTSRQAAMLTQVEKLSALQASNQKVMINQGNDYVIAYSDMVTNMVLGGTEYTIIDETIPFYQLALHGLVNYTGEPLNLTQDKQDELLHSAEYGAGLSFTLMKETAFTLQSTLYTQYFGADYDAWHDEMFAIYNRYNSELGHTFNQRMASHEYVQTSVACTTYEDGTKVYVNYNYGDVTVDGITVPARDYTVVR